MKKWNKQPVVKSVFFDDFSQGIRTDVWRALNERWKSQKNNGYSQDNCMFSTNPKHVSQLGATGGVVIIKSNGDFSPNADTKRQGGGIVTKQLFGAGKYEARLKVVPRVGQCSAIWTYYNNWNPEWDKLQYSEIDLESPYGGDYRHWTGTTYEKFLNGENKICQSQDVQTLPLNDGKWHVLCFEWRTDKQNDDVGIIWYLDDKPILRIDEAVPEYTATFWVASLFQDAVAWLGDPLFQEAYMYIDWVRITEYTDACLDGSAEKESKLNFVGIDLCDEVIPQTNYLANANFTEPAMVLSYKGRQITSWNIANGSIVGGNLLLDSGKASQTIYAQYDGYVFNFELQGQTDGEVFVYLEYLNGKANMVDPTLTVVGKSHNLTLQKGQNCLCGELAVDCSQTDHIRLVIESVGQSTIQCVKLTLKQ